jgi:hypothetical protein
MWKFCVGYSKSHAFLFAAADDIAVAGTYNEIRAIHTHFYLFSLSRFSIIFWYVSNAVLASQFLGNTLESLF